ncbi:MAG: DUF423 domain-containing protein [Anaerolineales bacterium]
MDRTFTVFASVFGFSAVAAGAVGGHALRGYFGAHPGTRATFDTAVEYHLAHALALGLTAWAAGKWPGAWSSAAGWLMFVGILLFSGSLYLLSLSRLRAWGMLTPLGGVALLVGWASLAVAALRG